MMTSGAKKAGFWVRFPALALDTALGGIVFGVLQRIVGVRVGGVLAILMGLGYYVSCWTTTGQTLGHRALGLKVIRTNGEQLTVGHATRRYAGYFLAALPLGLGLLWAGWDANKQGWHDKLADTYVVKV